MKKKKNFRIFLVHKKEEVATGVNLGNVIRIVASKPLWNTLWCVFFLLGNNRRAARSVQKYKFNFSDRPFKKSENVQPFFGLRWKGHKKFSAVKNLYTGECFQLHVLIFLKKCFSLFSMFFCFFLIFHLCIVFYFSCIFKNSQNFFFNFISSVRQM